MTGAGFENVRAAKPMASCRDTTGWHVFELSEPKFICAGEKGTKSNFPSLRTIPRMYGKFDFAPFHPQ